MLNYAANISILWRDLPVRERLERVSRAGLGAFEFLFLETFDLEDLVAGKEELGLQVALFDPTIGDPTFKTSNGYLGLPDAEPEFFASLEQALEAAQRLGCPRLNTLAGKRVPVLSWEEQRDVAVDRLRRAAPGAAQAGITLLVEPISTLHLPDYLVNYSWQALEIVDLVDHPNVRYQCDLYHLQIMEGNLTDTLLRHLPKVGHVQVADVPGRHEPGTGEVNYPNVLRALESAGYRGFVGLEYSPLDPERPFEWLAQLRQASAAVT